MSPRASCMIYVLEEGNRPPINNAYFFKREVFCVRRFMVIAHWYLSVISIECAPWQFRQKSQNVSFTFHGDGRLDEMTSESLASKNSGPKEINK